MSINEGLVAEDFLLVLGLFAFVLVLRRLSWPLARRLVLLSRYAARARAQRPERRATLQGIVADVIALSGLIAAVIVALVRLFHIDPDTIVWSIGLFSVAFGLSARPIISDLFSGISLVFGDIYAVGEKVEVAGVEGVVEEVTLRTTRLRADTGELFVVPNGEVRVVRNYARGSFSVASVTVTVDSADVVRALDVLRELGDVAAAELDDLLSPPQIVSETGALGATTTLTLVAHARYGRGADLRPRLLALVERAFAAADIDLGT